MAASPARRAVRCCGSRDPRSLFYALADAQLLHLRTCSHPAEGHSACSLRSLLPCAPSTQCAVHVRNSTGAPRGTRGSTSGASSAGSTQRANLGSCFHEEQGSTSGRAAEEAQQRRQLLLRAWGKWRELHPLASRGLQSLPQGCLPSPGAPGGWSASRPLSGAAATALPPDALPSREDPWQPKEAQAGRGARGGTREGRRGTEEDRPRASLDAQAEDHAARYEEAHRGREDAQRPLLEAERRELRRRQGLRKGRWQSNWDPDLSAREQGQPGGLDHDQREAAQRSPSRTMPSSGWRENGGVSAGPSSGSDPAQLHSSVLGPDSWWSAPHSPWLLPEPSGAGAALPLPEEQRFLRVAVVGAPNAGKSSLVNCLVNARVSAVSRKTNTTTKEVLGICTQGNTQLVFHDTPGLLQEVSGRPLSQGARASAKAATSVMERCQVMAMVVDADRQIRRPDPRVQRWAYRLGGAPTWRPETESGPMGASLDPSIFSQPGQAHPESPQAGQSSGEGSSAGPCPGPQTRILVLNKVDAVKDKKLLLPLAAHYGHLQGFQRTFMVSARKGKGVDDLKAYLEEMAIAGPWEEDPGRRTDQPVEELAMQMVRQALLNRLHQELPYRVQQQHVGTATLRDGSLRLEQRLLVETVNQRGILLGSQGHNIREIGTVARRHVEEALGCRVHLILDVKVARK